MSRLAILFVSQVPPSPAASGVQRRIEGLMTALSKRHDLACVTLISPDLDQREVARAMAAYCPEVHFVQARPWHGLGKRLTQLRSIASRRSFERRILDVPGLAEAVQHALAARRFDVLCVESPFLDLQGKTLVSSGAPPPVRILDEHNIEGDLARQQTLTLNPARRLHNAVNWRKVRREELQALRAFDGVSFCSAADQARARELAPGLRSAVVPNAVDLDYFQPSKTYPPSDRRTVMFFGAINYFPNIDGLRFLFHDVWPQLAASHPQARLRIVGQHPTDEIRAFQGPRVDVTGRVDDLRPCLASAAVTIAPLRIGGGTRLKILEAMAMARPVVSTSRGAEGIDAQPGRDILIGDDAESLVAQLRRVLDAPELGEQIGAQGRRLVEQSYSWTAAAVHFEALVRELGVRPRG